MFKKLLKNLGLIFVFFVICLFAKDFFLQAKIPIPGDTIVGLYHPFRDTVWDGLTSGVPFKNFLITDAVRQQYPWRELALSMLAEGQFPLWNPYVFSGTLLLANLQSAVLNPLNILFLFLPFKISWSMQVLLQLFLAAGFLYAFLKNFRFKEEAIVMSCLSWIFGGFFVAWLEWNTILQAALWLPLILLAKEKIIFYFKKNNFRFSTLLTSQLYKWILVLVFAESFSLFAGHLQTFFYIVVFSSLYLKLRFFSFAKSNRELKALCVLFLLTGTFSLLLMSVQLFPTLEFIFHSARNFDQPLGFRTDWYLPWKHLTQLFVPDFFGNPTTLNYWGEWNYGEFVSYMGVIPLFFGIIAMLFRRDKKTYFFTAGFFISLLFALPNFISFLPYTLKLPFLSTTAPSRVLFLTNFSLSMLCVLGLDYFIKEKKKTKLILLPSIIISIIFSIFWSMVLVPSLFHFPLEMLEKLAVTKRNLILPSFILILTPLLLVVGSWLKKEKVTILLLILVTTFDLLRFTLKFNPFVKQEWVFPSTKTTQFLQQQEKPFRIVATDSRIFPPNFSVYYRLESVEGYDPLYLKRYGEFWAAGLRNKPDTSGFNFNRIITPQQVENPFLDLLGAKYILSFNEYQNYSLKKVFTEGQTKIYENMEAFPRAFMVGQTIPVNNKEVAIKKLFENKNNLDNVAIVEGKITVPFSKNGQFTSQVNIGQYSEQSITVETRSNNPGFLVVSNPYYSGWQATIDGERVTINKTNYFMQGVLVPAGTHEVKFTFISLSFWLGLATSVLGLTLLALWGLVVWKRK